MSECERGLSKPGGLNMTMMMESEGVQGQSNGEGKGSGKGGEADEMDENG